MHKDTTEAWIAALEAAGATGRGIAELELSFLSGQGYTSGTLGDRWHQYLGDKGYTGSLQDRWQQAIAADDMFAPGPTLLVYDSFTEANGTLLTSRTPDTDNTGVGWSVSGTDGDYEISASALMISNSALEQAAYFDSDAEAILLEAGKASTGDPFNLAVRHIDTNNYFRVLGNTETNAVVLVEKDAGSVTVRANVAAGETVNTAYAAVTPGGISGGANRGAELFNYSTTLHDSSTRYGVLNTDGAFPRSVDNFYLMSGTTDPADLP